MSNIMTVLLLLVLAFYSVNGRTCTCASFVAEQCNAQENCAWNDRNALGLISKGEKGICRSSKWMDCHLDESCVITGRYAEVEEEEDEEADFGPNAKGPKGQRNGNNDKGQRRLAEVEAADLDWPYNCVDNEYHDDVMDIRSFELAAQESVGEVIMDNVGKTSHKKKGNLVFNVAALAVVAMIVGVALFYKYKGNQKGLGLLENTLESSYSSV